MAALYKTLDRSIRSIKREVNLTVLKLPETEQKALDATCNEPWGPHGQLLAELARASYDPVQYALIMGVLWRRMLDTGKDWRHVYKALLVVEYMVAHGAESVVRELGERVGRVKSLTEFQYVEPTTGRDEGYSVRVKAKALLYLLKDKRHVQEVREHAANAAKNIKGYSLGPAIQHVSLYGSRSSSSSSSSSSSGGGMRRKSLEDVRGSPDEGNSVVGCVKENMDEDDEEEGDEEEEEETQGTRCLKGHEGKVAPPPSQPRQESNDVTTTRTTTWSEVEHGARNDGDDKDCGGGGVDDDNDDGQDGDDEDFNPRRAHVLTQASGASPNGGAAQGGSGDAPMLLTKRDAHTAGGGEEEFNPRRAATLPQPTSVSHRGVRVAGAGGSSWGGGDGAAASTDADDDFNPRAATVLQPGLTGVPLAGALPAAAPSPASAELAAPVWTAADSAVAYGTSDCTTDLCYALTPFTATHTVLPSWQLGMASPSSVFTPPSSLASPSEATFATFAVQSASSASHFNPGRPSPAIDPNPTPFPSFPPQGHPERNHTTPHPFPSFPTSLIAQPLPQNPMPPHHTHTYPLPFPSTFSSSHHSAASLSPPTPPTSMHHGSWSAAPFPPTAPSPSTLQHPPPSSPPISPAPASYLPLPVSASASTAAHTQFPTQPPRLPAAWSSLRPSSSSSTQPDAPLSHATLSGTKGPGKESRIFDEVLSSGLVDLRISLPSDTPLGKVGVLPKSKLKSIREQQQEARSPTTPVKYGFPAGGPLSSARSQAQPHMVQQGMFVQGLS